MALYGGHGKCRDSKLKAETPQEKTDTYGLFEDPQPGQA